MYHFWGRVALSWALIDTLCAYNELRGLCFIHAKSPATGTPPLETPVFFFESSKPRSSARWLSHFPCVIGDPIYLFVEGMVVVGEAVSEQRDFFFEVHQEHWYII